VTDNITLPRAVVEFLLGEGPLDGVWYGDEHPTNPRPYWWRKHIRAALAEPEQKPEPATDEQIIKSHMQNDRWILASVQYFYNGWRQAERFHGIRKGDKT